MVQILPGVPSFGGQLAQALTQAGADIGQGFQQRRARTALEKLLNPEGGSVDSGGQMSGTTTSEISPFATSQAIDLAIQSGMNPAAATALGSAVLKKQELAAKEAADIRAEERKVAAEQKKSFQEKTDRQVNFQKTFNVASSLLAKNTPGVGISPGAATGLSRKAVEGRNTFNTLKGKFESILLPMVNKGTLAKERFNFILSQIPDAADSQRAIAGKLRGLAETLSEEGFPIDTKVLDSIPWISEELKEPSNERPPLESFLK